MNAVREALLGRGFDSIDQACRRGDAIGAEYVLRTGRAIEERATAAAIATPADVSAEFVWARVRRISREEDGESNQDPASGLVGVFVSMLHRVGQRFCVKVRRSEFGENVYLGLADATLLMWAQRTLAPGVLLEPSPDSLSPLVAHPGMTYAIRFRPAPGTHDSNQEPVSPPLLERLAALGSGQWDVTLLCTPASPADVGRTMIELGELHRSIAARMTTTRTVDESTQVQSSDPSAQRVIDWLTVLTDELGHMRDSGAWLAFTTVAGDSEFISAQLAAAVAARGPQVNGAPTRTWLTDTFVTNHGLPAGDLIASVLDSAEVSSWLAPPRATRSSVEVGPPLPADRRSLSTRRPVWLGSWAGTEDRVELDIDDLAGHAFIAGVTGSGKSTTVTRLLLSAWNRHQVPFLVIDPVKDDYRTLASLTSDGLTVLRGRDLRFNVLRPLPGFDLATHLDYVSAAFKGAFSMPSPVPYVTTLLFDQLREQLDESDAVTLHDAQRSVRSLVTRLGYRGELESNILASLGVRLSVLCAPIRAERLCAAEPVVGLFDRPTVVALADIGDDEERGFLMSLLTIYVAEQAKLRPAGEGVRHLTVLEEAHRMVAQPATASDEQGDASGHAARLVTQLLAEIRSFGESIVLLDQSPAAVARDVVRNTNTKIIHRLLDPDDRELIGGAVGLESKATAFLTQLMPGQAALATARLPRPQLLQVDALSPSGSAAAKTAAPAAGRPCCGPDARSHHRAEAFAEAAGVILAEGLTACLVRSKQHARAIAEDVRRRLDQLAVRDTPVRVACLLDIGARVAADRWRVEGWVTPAQLAGLRGQLRTAFGPAGSGLTRAELPPVGATTIRPYQSCAQCAYACSIRPLARVHPDLSRIRDSGRGKSPLDFAALVAAWQTRVRLDLADTLGWDAANDTARCVILHALGDEAGAAGAAFRDPIAEKGGVR